MSYTRALTRVDRLEHPQLDGISIRHRSRHSRSGVIPRLPVLHCRYPTRPSRHPWPAGTLEAIALLPQPNRRLLDWRCVWWFHELCPHLDSILRSRQSMNRSTPLHAIKSDMMKLDKLLDPPKNNPCLSQLLPISRAARNLLNLRIS